ncbi:MAG: bestrophin family ion channel [Myxococcota bacterium]
MIINRRISLSNLLRFSSRTMAISAAWAGLVYLLYAHAGMDFLRVPFLPISTIGTAVAFYVGFKNNSAYDRFWEGRKIWGGIVNVSRTWATNVMSYIDVGDDSERARAARRELIYRQLAWINALRLQLRKTSRFYDKPVKATKLRLERHAEHMRNDWDQELAPFLEPEEHASASAQVNPATHLLNRQGLVLAQHVAEKRLDLFHQIAMMKLVEECYGLQGKCERIKNTPFPRQYAEFSRVFTRVFTFLVPFGLLDVFAADASDLGVLDSVLAVLPMVAASSLVSWVFRTMEGIGDSSEDPFERSMNDVPMNALCRTIERDLRQLLGETEIPAGESRIDNLMY